jgi:hypothetical protein
MTCEERTRPVRGGSEGEAEVTLSVSSLGTGGDTRNVEELLSLGREPTCGAAWFSVDIHLHECGRPMNHPDGCALEPTDADLAYGEPYPMPDRHEYAAELADQAQDDAVMWGGR